MYQNEIEIIAGRPSSGKTLFASQICREGVSQKLSVLYFSLELTDSYIKEHFGIPKEVIVIDDPNLDWMNIRTTLVKIEPNYTIIDYLQLIKDNSPNLINHIIKDHKSFYFNSNLVILSQVSKECIPGEKIKMHNSYLSTCSHNVTLTSLTKMTKKV